MAAYGWIVRKFIRYGEVITEHLAPGAVTPAKLQYNTTPTAVALVDGATAVAARPGTVYNFSYSIPDGNTKSYRIAVPFKCEILDIDSVKLTANASAVAGQDVLTFKNGIGGSTFAATDLVGTLFATANIKRATSFFPANVVIPAGGIIEITTAQTVSVACSFTIHLVASP
jgi:hypothetical protein